MLDPLDIPGSWTERQTGADRERRVRLTQHINSANTLAEQLTKAAAPRARWLPGRARLLAAKAAIEKLIAEAPDYQTIVDARERRQEWARQNALPGPLRELLTDGCAHMTQKQHRACDAKTSYPWKQNAAASARRFPGMGSYKVPGVPPLAHRSQPTEDRSRGDVRKVRPYGNSCFCTKSSGTDSVPAPRRRNHRWLHCVH